MPVKPMRKVPRAIDPATPDMFWKPEDFFWYWMNERHMIYVKRHKMRLPKPWTDDKILQSYKFTNVFRELDTVSLWMREHWTKPNWNAPLWQTVLNCGIFRFFGTTEFAALLGWQKRFEPEHMTDLAYAMLAGGGRVFTGAYIISNFGQRRPKQEVIVEDVLAPFAEECKAIAKVARKTRSLQATFEAMSHLYGFGGNGFMAYEIVSDLRHTKVLHDCEDNLTWANAGPGAKRGLNRIHERPLNAPVRPQQALEEMQELWRGAIRDGKVGQHIVKQARFEMREIEHSLCEFDKYMRVHNDEGRPRGRYDGTP